MGLAAAGSATGGVVLPAMIQQLLPRIGQCTFEMS